MSFQKNKFSSILFNETRFFAYKHLANAENMLPLYKHIK